MYRTNIKEGSFTKHPLKRIYLQCTH